MLIIAHEDYIFYSLFSISNGLAKGIVCTLDMLVILFVFRHRKSPILNNGSVRQSPS